MDIYEELFNLKDDKYADFQCKLTPGVEREQFIGVRVPLVRKLAKKIYTSGDYEDFLEELPHKYFDENMLQGLIISEYKDYDSCVEAVDRFLPYVDNWAVCDIMSPKVFKKNKDRLLDKIKLWIESEHTYTCRFGIEMLMSHYLEENFKEEYLDMVAKVESGEYYVNMMIAWYFATALAKQWDSTIKILEAKKLSEWVHNKTIQKARESYRITDSQKEYLKSIKV